MGNRRVDEGKHVLFVDDDERLISGLRRSLFRRRGEWTMSFAVGGDDGVTALSADRCDIVVTDMRMPGTNGLELLRHARDRHPATVRVMLSGHSDHEDLLSAVPLAHRFLAKPTDAEVLEATLERLFELRLRYGDRAQWERMGQVGSLPISSWSREETRSALSAPDVDWERLEAAVTADMSLAASVLHVARSAFFGAPHDVIRPEQAVHLLGAEMLGAALENEATSIDGVKDLTPLVDHLSTRGAVAAGVAAHLATGENWAAVAETAARLDGVGRLALEVVGSDGSQDEAAEAGAYLLGLWGLPSGVVGAVGARPEDPATRAPSWSERAAVEIATRVADAVLDDDPSALERARALLVSHDRDGEIESLCSHARAIVAELGGRRVAA